MPGFYFKIVSDASGPISHGPFEFADASGARAEAAAVFSDFSRNIAANLAASPEWNLDLLDDAGKLIYRIKVVAKAT